MLGGRLTARCWDHCSSLLPFGLKAYLENLAAAHAPSETDPSATQSVQGSRTELPLRGFPPSRAAGHPLELQPQVSGAGHAEDWSQAGF